MKLSLKHMDNFTFYFINICQKKLFQKLFDQDHNQHARDKHTGGDVKNTVSYLGGKTFAGIEPDQKNLRPVPDHRHGCVSVIQPNKRCLSILHVLQLFQNFSPVCGLDHLGFRYIVFGHAQQGSGFHINTEKNRSPVRWNIPYRLFDKTSVFLRSILFFCFTVFHSSILNF